MKDIAQVFRQALIFNMRRCCNQMEFSQSEAVFRSISDILDSNEKLLQTCSATITRSIFSSLRAANNDNEGICKVEELDAQEKINLNLSDQISWWTMLDEHTPLDELLQRAEKEFGQLAMPFESSDIPLFEYSRILAGIFCCLEGAPPKADQQELMLYSIDLSGIQAFLYSIGNKGALKGLKTRSFYLNILMVHVADMILELCGLSRLNLIYCGGGKAHLLLANQPGMLQAADSIIEQVNRFLQRHFGTALYLARGYAPASLREFASWNGDTDCFSALFRKTSAMISERKLKRYCADELRAFNSREEDHERECVICGNGSHLTERDGEYVCADCLRFEQFALLLNKSNMRFAIQEAPVEPFLSLPGGDDLGLCALENAAHPLRVYNVNMPEAHSGYPLYIGNYQPSANEPVTFEMLGSSSEGIKRLGLLRMDVDNLGSMFASGFYAADSEHPYSKASLVRYSTLSAALTQFFQYQINDMIAFKRTDCSLSSAHSRYVSVVYSGGDDLFLIGAWNDVLDAALVIHDAFCAYTHGKASISGGFGIFGFTEPIRHMAAYCAELEDEAKQTPGKDSICLFDPAWSFPWKEYKGMILREMLPSIESLCKHEEKGNTFLYHVLELMRSIDSDPIAVARLAYLLARHKPKGAAENYDTVSHCLYEWALNSTHNQQLQVAIQLYIYLHREVISNE